MRLVPTGMRLRADLRAGMGACQPRRRTSPVADRPSRVTMSGQAGWGRDIVVMTMTVRVNLVLGIPGHVTCMSTVFPTTRQVSLVMVFRTVCTAGSARMARRSAQRSRRGESTEMEMRCMGTVAMRMRAVRAVLHHLLMMSRIWREQGHALHRSENRAGQRSKVETLSNRPSWIFEIVLGRRRNGRRRGRGGIRAEAMSLSLRMVTGLSRGLLRSRLMHHVRPTRTLERARGRGGPSSLRVTVRIALRLELSEQLLLILPLLGLISGEPL